MTPVEWAMRPLKRYADFSGRAPRAEYWWFYLAYFVASLVMNVLTSIIPLLGFVFLLVMLGLIIPMLAVGVRRLHDIDRTGWWLLAPAIPYAIAIAMMGTAFLGDPTSLASSAGLGTAGIFMLIGFVMALVVFVFTLLPGTKGENRYGPDPYGPQNLDEVFA